MAKKTKVVLYYPKTQPCPDCLERGLTAIGKRVDKDNRQAWYVCRKCKLKFNVEHPQMIKRGKSTLDRPKWLKRHNLSSVLFPNQGLNIRAKIIAKSRLGKSKKVKASG